MRARRGARCARTIWERLMNGGDELDRRIHAYRADLADARLEGHVEAAQFVKGDLFRVVSAIAPFHKAPDPIAPRVATKLMGETLRIFDALGDWLWAQSDYDGYVGYVRARHVAKGGFEELYQDGDTIATVITPRAPIYLKPTARARALSWAPMGARLVIGDSGIETDGFLHVAGDRPGGWVHSAHVRRGSPSDAVDWVAAAERFEHTPYLWGGDSAEGIDCSGLISVARRSAGLHCPRDSDLQEHAFGEAVPDDSPYARGDLVFWRGHVGVMLDDETLLHSNAHVMRTARERREEAVRRIASLGYGAPTSRRRPT